MRSAELLYLRPKAAQQKYIWLILVTDKAYTQTPAFRRTNAPRQKKGAAIPLTVAFQLLLPKVAAEFRTRIGKNKTSFQGQKKGPTTGILRPP